MSSTRLFKNRELENERENIQYVVRNLFILRITRYVFTLKILNQFAIHLKIQKYMLFISLFHIKERI